MYPFEHQQTFNELYGFIRFEVFAAVTMKNAVFLNVMPCDYRKNRLSEGSIASIIRVIRIGGLGKNFSLRIN
jgi:hypothetical protein